MRPYPEYKESGVEWLGQVPVGWEVVPLKRYCTFFTGWTPPTGNSADYIGDNAWANISDLGEKYISSTSKSLSDEAVNRHRMREVEPGSLLFSFKLSIGFVSITTTPMYTNEAIAAFPPQDDVCISFAYYAFPEMITKNAAVNIYGAKILNQELIRNSTLCLPPLSEQRAIAAFLDREVAKIDALIEESRALIAALAEKRQATISHAVTRGLNPSARLKPSGVDWLGDIPEGWEVVPLKRLGWFAAGAGFPHDEQGLEGEELPFFKVNALGKAGADDVLIPDVDTVSRETADRLRAPIFPKGAIVFAKIGAALLLGRIRTLPCEACIDNNMMGFFSSPDQTPDFIRFAMSLLRFDVISNPGTVPSLNESQIAEQRIPLPPRVEQLAIVDHILAETARLDALTEEARAAIALLQERRAALISAAVTGKIDTRDTVAAA